jgi:hypothetical protein
MVINGECTRYPASLPVDTSVTPPHPYFGCKFLVFLRLQTGLRCKIFKTKEFPAKSSWIRSYGLFSATSGLIVPEGMPLRMIVLQKGEIICKDREQRSVNREQNCGLVRLCKKM